MSIKLRAFALPFGFLSLFIVPMAQADMDRANEMNDKAASIMERLNDISNGEVDKIEEDIKDDVRRRAMQDVAESLGAQEGYNYYINKFLAKLEENEDIMNHFNFRSLMTAATDDSTEMYVLPPVIEKLENAEAVNTSGTQLKLTGEIYRILSNVRLVTAPPTWRDYLQPVGMSNTNKPPKDLLPKNKEEKIRWGQWVKSGFQAGLEQGDREMRHRVSQIRTDFLGMVRYMNLVESGMVKEPVVALEHIRTEGDGGELKVRSSIYEITSGASLVINHEKWKEISNDNDRTNLKTNLNK